MAEQQLVDYIKKARDAGQTDSQTRDLLYKNGWTEVEVSDALVSLNQPQAQSQQKPQPQPQAVDLSKTEVKPQEVQPQVTTQPKQAQPQPQLEAVKIEIQPQIVRQPEPQYQPQFPQSNMPRTKVRSHTFLKFLMVLIIVVVLGGAGYFVAGQYINLPWNPFQNLSWSQILTFPGNLFGAPSPEKVINNMMVNMKDVKSSHTIMQLEIDATNSDAKTSQGKLILNTNSETDITDANNPKSDGNFTVNLTTPGSASPVTATVSIAAIGNVFYLKINEITIPAGSSFYPGLDISKIQGKWLKIDQDSIKALSQATGEQVTTGIDISQLSQIQINSSELTKKFQDLLVTENIFSVTKQINDETIGGQDTYHYLTTIDKDKLKDLVGKIMEIELQQSSGSQTEGSANNSNLLTKNMVQAVANTFIDSIGNINMEMWIGKKDNMLYQAKIDKTIDLGKILQSYYGSALSSNVQVEVKLNLTNSNFNKPITVQAPAAAQKIEDVILPLIKMQTINNDMKQIGFEAQTLYFTNNNNYSSLCRNGFLNGPKKRSYGLELIRIVSDLTKQGAKNPACFAGIQNYCVSTQLTDGNYLCIDKNQKLGTTKCTSAQTVCK